MEEADLKKEYDETLSRYTQKRSECNNIEKEISTLKAQIQALRNRLNQPTTHSQDSNQTESLQLAQQQQKLLATQYSALVSQLQKQQAENTSRIASYNRIIQQHHCSLRELQINHKSAVFVVDSSHTEQARLSLDATKQKVISEVQRINQLKKDIEDEQRFLTELQREVELLHEAKNKRDHIGDVIQQPNNLENELKIIQKEQSSLAQELNRLQISKQQTKNRAQSQNKQKISQLESLKLQNNTLKSQLQRLNSENSTVNINDRNEILAKEIKNLEEAQKNVNKELDDLSKEIAVKKQIETLKKQQSKKQKNKDKRNFKQEIAEEEKLIQMLIRQCEREKNKLQDTIKLRKTYVSNENLQILQKEYERQQIKNRPSLQTQESKRQKLAKERQIIKSRIQFLKQSTKGLELQSQKSLKDHRAKGDDLVKQKLASEKVLNETTFKLNQYFKEFPDHEKQKQEAKHQEKRRRHEAKLKAKEQQREKDILKKKIAKEQKIQSALTEDSTKTQWEKWDEWDKANNLPKRDEKSLFNNKQFQLIAAAIAIVLILTLSFS